MTYSIHTRNKRVVRARVILHGHEDSVSLGSRDVDHVCLGGLSPNAVNLDNLHCVTFKPHILRCKSSNINKVQEIGLSRLDVHGEGGGVIDQGCVGHGLSAGRVLVVDEALEQVTKLVVIPVGECNNALFIILTQVGVFRVRNDQSLAESFRVLASGVRVVPVRAGLIELYDLAC